MHSQQHIKISHGFLGFKISILQDLLVLRDVGLTLVILCSEV